MSFIYCFDETLKDKLSKKLNLLVNKEINGKECWIFENNNKFTFSKEETDVLMFTNKFYI